MPQEIYESVLRLVGAGAYIRQINQAAQAHRALAQAQQQQAQGQAALQAAQANFRVMGNAYRLGMVAPGGFSGAARQVLGAQAGLAGANAAAMAAEAAARSSTTTAIAIAAMAALSAAVKSGVDAFSDYQRAVIRTETVAKNMGVALPTRQFLEFSRQLALSTGSSQTELANLGGYLARFGVSGEAQFEKSARVIVNASKLTGKSISEMAAEFEGARRGRGFQLFRDLGIPIRQVQGYLGNWDQILDAVDRRTKDLANNMSKTLPGAIDRASSAFEDLKIQFGRLISPEAIFVLNGLAYAMTFFANSMKSVSDRLGIPLGALGGSASAAAGTAAAGRSEAYLREISFNTGPQGALGHALRGGGSFGEPGGGLRIRDYNQMQRHVG